MSVKLLCEVRQDGCHGFDHDVQEVVLDSQTGQAGRGGLAVAVTPEDKRRKEGNILFNDALNTFYLRLYGVRHMVKDHSDSEKGNPLPPHRLLFPFNSKGSFICTIPQKG